MAGKQLQMDFSGFKNMTRELRLGVIADFSKVIDESHDRVLTKIMAYLSGPHYKPGTKSDFAGQVPIPVVTGDLRRSVKTARYELLMWLIWSDGSVAPYNTKVHDGGKEKKNPRPFIKRPVDQSRPEELRRWESKLIDIIVNKSRTL